MAKRIKKSAMYSESDSPETVISSPGGWLDTTIAAIEAHKDRKDLASMVTTDTMEKYLLISTNLAELRKSRALTCLHTSAVAEVAIVLGLRKRS